MNHLQLLTARMVGKQLANIGLAIYNYDLAKCLITMSHKWSWDDYTPYMKYKVSSVVQSSSAVHHFHTLHCLQPTCKLLYVWTGQGDDIIQS